MPYITIAFLAVLLLLAGCATPGPQPPATSPPAAARPPGPAPPPPEPPKPLPPTRPLADIALDQGMALYDAGDYNGAIKVLAAPEIAEGPVSGRVQAHKFSALSYCLTNRRPLCRQQFGEALKLDPSFALAPAEKTHPVWSAEYEGAKKAAATPPTPATTPARPAQPRPAPPPAKPGT